MWLGVGDLDSALIQPLAATGGDSFKGDYSERVGHSGYEVSSGVFGLDGDDAHPFGDLIEAFAVMVVHQMDGIAGPETLRGLRGGMVDTLKHEVSELCGYVTHGSGHPYPRLGASFGSFAGAVPR